MLLCDEWIFCSACLPGRQGLQSVFTYVSAFLEYTITQHTQGTPRLFFFSFLKKNQFLSSWNIFVFFKPRSVSKAIGVLWMWCTETLTIPVKETLISWQHNSLPVYWNVGWAPDLQETSTFTRTSSIFTCAPIFLLQKVIKYLLNIPSNATENTYASKPHHQEQPPLLPSHSRKYFLN